MSITDIIWPWGRIKYLEIVIEGLSRLRDHDAAEVDRLQKAFSEADLRQRNAQQEIVRLKGILAKAHFRDPKTGRISKKGQVQ